MPSVLVTESWFVVGIILPSTCIVMFPFQWPTVEWCGVWTFRFLDEVPHGADRLGGLAYPRVENSAIRVEGGGDRATRRWTHFFWAVELLCVLCKRCEAEMDNRPQGMLDVHQ
ncbi:unnamed protein product [Ectocarpus sp. 12 AP-2014]